MKRTLKKCRKIIATAICLVMILSICIPMSFAANNGGVSINAGHDALRAQFSRDKGPKSGGYAIDYSYFTPVNAEKNEDRKYPLVVFLPGGTESKYEGQELIANSFCTWSSKEYQARFKDAGGAYIMIARAREDVAFHGTHLCSHQDFLPLSETLQPSIRMLTQTESISSAGATAEQAQSIRQLLTPTFMPQL